MSGFVIFDASVVGVVMFGEVVIGGVPAIGTPIITTYITRNATTMPRPYCTTSSKSPPAPLPPHARWGNYA